MQTYKLINNKTKEETICSLVTIDGFDYYVSGEKVKGGTFQSLPIQPLNRFGSRNSCYILDKKDNKIYFTNFDEQYCILDKHFLVIATNNPNIDIPKVIDETEESFNIVDDIKVRYSGEEADLWCSYKIGFGDGYNKAKETYQFTEEDMIEFRHFANNYGEIGDFEKSSEKLLELFKEQQIKTIFYE